MTGGARTSVMVGWGAVTGRTIRAADGGMVERGIFEIARVSVASSARSGKMIGWGTVTG